VDEIHRNPPKLEPVKQFAGFEARPRPTEHATRIVAIHGLFSIVSYFISHRSSLWKLATVIAIVTSILTD
jgi:hypothetical protein